MSLILTKDKVQRKVCSLMMLNHCDETIEQNPPRANVIVHTNVCSILLAEKLIGVENIQVTS
jgi:hypothetical protein